MTLVPAIVLAAGGSTRCPGGKLIRPLRGRPLLCWLLDTLQECSEVSSVVVVCGHQMDEIAPLTEPFDKIDVVRNPDWATGLSSSLKCGLNALPPGAPGAVVCLGDTPFFRAATLSAVVPDESSTDSIIIPCCDGHPGHPKYFPRRLFAELFQLQGDEGARPLLRDHKERTRFVEVDDPGILRDFDSPEDFLV